ncbi:ABC transporter permease subunit [Clostridium oryzae]|uniref:ABC-2 family transporter protein n=1 Tax=Clostridium oryzae TaxID=1450648 RepID=A0A1V4IWN4_9CLOT|nr:ABC transporter permease subunit [Clostridium oryzae]OPJ64230.1 ABC-2 family transporter protein [Clostridium oryzae]
MYNLIKFEMYKLKHSKIFRNLLIVTGVLIFLSMLIYYQLKNVWYIMYDSFGGRDYGFVINSFKDRLHPKALEFFYSAAGFSNIMEILVMFLVGAFIIDEYSNGTIKNIVAHGHKRIHIYLSKLLVMAVAILIMNAMLLFGTAIVGALSTGQVLTFSMDSIVEMIGFTIIVCLILIEMASIYMFFATLIKSKALIIGVGTVILFSSFIFMHPLCNYIEQYPEYTPTYILMDICTIHPDTAAIGHILITCCITILITTLLGILSFDRQDIK